MLAFGKVSRLVIEVHVNVAHGGVLKVALMRHDIHIPVVVEIAKREFICTFAQGDARPRGESAVPRSVEDLKKSRNAAVGTRNDQVEIAVFVYVGSQDILRSPDRIL